MHPLDRGRASYYCYREARMSLCDQFVSVRVSLSWRLCLSLLLAGLFLYNPFLGKAGFDGGLIVRHPASHRATVGASELQHFTAAEGRDALSGPDTVDAAPVSALMDLTAQTIIRSSENVPPPQQFLWASLWFRPPPVR